MAAFLRFLAAVAIALCAATASGAPRDGIDVRLSVRSPVVYGDADVVVTVTITNTTRVPVRVLRWQLPSDEAEGALFRITRDDGMLVPYTGPLFKRAAPDGSDQVQLDPGVALSQDVELTSTYDFSRAGRYAIEYLSRGVQGASSYTLKSDILYVWLEGRSAKIKPPAPPPPPGPSISFTGNCSASQQSTLQAAVVAATGYAASSADYLDHPRSASSRYATWFGEYSVAHWTIAQGHFSRIYDAFASQALVLDCKCKKPRYYAYVYASQPYKIYVCGAFWSAPPTGTDSRAGTLIHEMSHFNVVAETDDWAYGQAAARALAVSDPIKALDNADNHEYFAENDPFLP